MASVQFNAEAAENRVNRLAVRQHGPSLADIPLFHYGLRQLLLFVAVICALLAAMVSTNGVTALILLVGSAVVAMHVFATSIGTRLRAQTDEEQLRNSAEPIGLELTAKAAEQLAKLAAIRSAPRSPWHARGCTYLPWLPRLVVVTMALGGIAGALLLSGLIRHHVSPAGVVVGASSFAVLGGWFSFLCGNFYGVFRHGFREAVAEERKNQPHH